MSDAHDPLRQCLTASRDLLALLDKEIHEAGKAAPHWLLELGDVEQAQPFVYSTVTSEGVAGMNDLGNGTFMGLVRVDSDSAFVLERILSSLVGIGSGGLASLHPAQNVEVTIEEVNTGREIVVVSRDPRTAGLAGATTPSFGLLQEFLAPEIRAARGGVLAPAECIFPRNATLKVVSNFPFEGNIAPPLLFNGYKLFGG